MGNYSKAESFQLRAGTASIIGEFSEKLKNNRKLAAIGTTPLALVLSACGGGSSTTTTSSNLLTLTKSADTYSASAVTGFTVTDSSTAKFDVADATANSYEIKLDATGTGVLEFDFADAGDTVTLAAGSKTSGFTTLKVTDGTLDATSADLSGITRVEVASGLKISLAQIKEIPTLVANSATSEITVELASEAEATELVALISAGTVQVFADVNPIKLVAAPTATIATETLTAKQTETTASVKPATEAPADTASTDTTTDTETEDTSTDTDTTTTGGGGGGGTSTIDFGLIKSGAGTYIVGTKNGDVTVSVSGDLATFTPTSGVAVTNVAADVTGLRVDDITLTASAAIASGKTITGNGNLTVTALDATAAADLSLITATGTLTANVADDVTFTGDLGTFAVTVDTGKTLTTTAAKATGLAITGAGGVSITAVDADADADLSSITASGTLTANVADDVTFTGDLGTFGVTVDSGKTLTTTSDKVTGLTITGGSVTISDDITANTNITNISSTVDLSQADVAISTSKTLTLTAAQAATETFSGAGTLAVTASSTDDSFTAGAAILSIATGTGDDVLTAGAAANITAADEIDLGGGTADAIVISADGDNTGAVFDEAGYAGAETITVSANGTTASTNAKVTLTHAADFDQDTIIDASGMSDSGADFVFAVTTASRVTGDLTVKASGGANTLAGGIGNDTFDFGNAAQFVATDAVTAGAGTDVIKITADDDGTGATYDDGNTGVGKIQIVESDTATDDVNLTLNFASAVTTALEINASALTNSGAVFTLALDSGNAGNVDGQLTVVGGAGNDVIAGGDAVDTITGGDGTDTMAGAGGADIFIFDADDSAAVAVANDSSTGGDTLSDFAKTSDKIQITGVLSTGFDASTDVLIGASGGQTQDAAVAGIADFVNGTYLVARDGVVTDGFDTAIKVFSSGSTAAFASNADAQAATMFNVTLGNSGNTVVLGANNDTIVGGDLDDVITGKAGIDSLTGGAGDDTFILTDSDDDGVGETYTGGDGTADKISIATTEVINLSDDTIATVEVLDLAVGSSNNLGVTVTAAQQAAFTTITADASDKIIVNTLTGKTVAATDAVDVFDFASGDAGVAITGFSIATEADVLDVVGLGTYTLLNESGGTITQTTASAASTEGVTVAVGDNKAILVEVVDGTTVDTAAEIVTALADDGVLDAIDIAQAASNTALLIVGEATTGTSVYVYQFTDDGVAASVDIAELTLVATVTEAADIINDLVAGNFGLS